jgi:hypothetical protein
MMTATQAQALELLARALALNPEMRIGQLVDWVAFMARPDEPQPTSNVEDDEFLQALTEHLNNLQRRSTAAAASERDSAPVPG